MRRPWWFPIGHYGRVTKTTERSITSLLVLGGIVEIGACALSVLLGGVLFCVGCALSGGFTLVFVGRHLLALARDPQRSGRPLPERAAVLIQATLSVLPMLIVGGILVAVGSMYPLALLLAGIFLGSAIALTPLWSGLVLLLPKRGA